MINIGLTWLILFFLFCGIVGVGTYICCIYSFRFNKEESAIIPFKKFVLFYKLNPESYELDHHGPIRLGKYSGCKDVYIYFNFLDMIKYDAFRRKQNLIKLNKKNIQQTLILTKMVKMDIENIEHESKIYIKEAKDYVDGI